MLCTGGVVTNIIPGNCELYKGILHISVMNSYCKNAQCLIVRNIGAAVMQILGKINPTSDCFYYSLKAFMFFEKKTVQRQT